MLTWYVVYDDDPAVLSDWPVHEEGADKADMLRRFDAAGEDGAIGGHKLRGMWIVDYDSEQQDVARAWGKYPHNLHF